MKKIVFEGKESSLFISKIENEIRIEMIDNGVNINDYQLGDNYNNIILNNEEAIDLAEEILKISKNGE
jgi:hypothetical protein